MSILILNSLGLTLGAPLFHDLSLTLHPGDRIGLVAANGRGKSSLLRCLAGTEEPTFGTLMRARGLMVGLMEQEVSAGLLGLSLRAAVLAALPPEEAEAEGWRADVVLEELGLPSALHDQPLGSLSGGWQRMALLARVWIGAPDLLLLDEPTNHLDLQRIAALEGWIRGLPRSMPLVIASHDRAFLDAVTNRTLFLRSERSVMFPLGYTRARLALLEADASAGRQFENDMKKADQLRRQAAKLKNIGINSGSDLLVVKTRQLSERAEKIEATARPAAKDRPAGVIRLAHGATRAKALLALEDAVISSPDGRLLFSTGQKWIERGERIVLLGANGVGKSCLIRAVQAAIGGEAGSIRATPSLVPGYMDQGLGQMGMNETSFGAITTRFDLADGPARSVLAGAGIAPDWQVRPVATLSGGQRARLALLALRLARPSFYLLDEPTNHLDIEGQEALEAELQAEGATALIVSHDRAFVRAVGTRFWQIIGKMLVEVEDAEGFFRAAAG
jgi:ATPase subunit of ABC transporter with duplicated ATPase domains